MSHGALGGVLAMDALCAQLRGNFGKDLAAKAVNGDATTDFGMSDIGGLQRSSGDWSVAPRTVFFVLEKILYGYFAADPLTLTNVSSNLGIKVPWFFRMGIAQSQFAHADIASHTFGIQNFLSINGDLNV